MVQIARTPVRPVLTLVLACLGLLVALTACGGGLVRRRVRSRRHRRTGALVSDGGDHRAGRDVECRAA